jgi:hypothetical protein
VAGDAQGIVHDDASAIGSELVVLNQFLDDGVGRVADG